MAKYVNGTKLYHYAYGPMTVVGCDEKYVEVVIDHPEFVSSELVKNEVKTFALVCVGQWIFERESDVGNESKDFVHGSTTIQINGDLLYEQYKGRSFASVSGDGSPVKAKNSNSDGSPVKRVNEVTGEEGSPVKAKK